MSPPIKKPRRKKADSEDACESTRGQRNDESPDGPADDLPSFEESLAELGRVVAELEQGDLSLAESLEQYEAGIRHLRQCYRQLEQAERRVELLTSVTRDGEEQTEVFDEEAMTLEEKAGRRDARRSAPGSRRPTDSAGPWSS